MTPPKPPRTGSKMKYAISSSYEVAQSADGDPDAPTPEVTDEAQSEDEFKPVPRPRSKIQPKAERNTNNNNTLDSTDTTSNTTTAESSQLSESPADNKKPRPVRPPPVSPSSRYAYASRATAVDKADRCLNSVTEPTVKSPDTSSEKVQAPPTSRPERPPLPSVYYDRLSSMKLKSESDTEESQQSKRSSISSTEGSLPVSDEVDNLFGIYGSTTTDSTDTPEVLPQPEDSSFPRSVYQASPAQTKPPPPPSSDPPPRPLTESQSESLYSEVECPPYLRVLPDDGDTIKTMKGPSTLPSRYSLPSRSYSSYPHTTETTDDINGMLRWLSRVSKSEFMAPSVYGLSIEEEIRSFNQRAMNVRKALRLYNLLMMRRSETLRNVITEFTSISDSLDKIKKKNKTMGIAGSTTGAVGGVTAVLGIALAPVTLGASLIATAVGAGMVASAGGLRVHTAKASKKIVNRMTVEKLVSDYNENIVDLEHCLDFILSEMNELRRYDIARLQRAGTQPDAVKMAHLSQHVFSNNVNNDGKVSAAYTRGMSSEKLLQAFAKEIDQYFSDDQKLRKSIKSRFSGRVRLLAENLQDELDHLHHMWEMFS